MLAHGSAHQAKALCIGTHLGREQCAADFLDRAFPIGGHAGLWARQHRRGGDPLGLQGAHGAREDGVGNGRCRHAHVQRHLAGPFAGALLLGGIEDQIDQGQTGVRIMAGQNLGGDTDQVAAQLALVPLPEHLADLAGRHAQHLMHQPIGLADGLHVGVFDAVVHHLDEMARTARSHPFAAGLSIVSAGGNRLHHVAHQGPGLGRAA